MVHPCRHGLLPRRRLYRGPGRWHGEFRARVLPDQDRIGLLAAKSISQLAGLLTVLVVISGVVGFFFMPDTSGKSLEQIERERA